jgi:long-subunit fatty acid transport protein
LARLPSALLVAVLAGAAATATAGPLDDPHVGGIGFGGPTTGDLTAVFWNPAALGLMEGTQATVVASGQFGNTSVSRTAIDPVTGLPGGGRSFPSASGTGSVHPAVLPPGPGSFVAVGAEIGNRFALALAAYAPFVQRLSYDSDATRYHLVSADLRNVALVPALAFRVGSNWRIGAAPGFLFSAGRLVFDEDTALSGGSGAQGLGSDCGGAPCGAENPAAAARYDVASGLGWFDSKLAFTLAAGLYYRRDRLELGVSYSSRPLGNEGGGVRIDADRTAVTTPPRAAAAGPLCPADQPSCLFAQIAYQLPDTFVAGATYWLSDQTSVTAIARWLTYSLQDRVSIRVVGPAPGGLRARGLADNVVLYRGLRDSAEGRVRLARQLGSLRFGVALRLQTPAVSPSRLSPADVDGFVIEPAAMLEARVARWLRLSAGYAFAFMPPVDTGDSVFDPGAAVACADAHEDLLTPACQARLRGAARPTAAGSYGFVRHAVSANATFRF